MRKSSFLVIIGVFAAVFLPVSSATAQKVDITVPDAGFDDHALNNLGDYVYIGGADYTGAWKSDVGNAYIDYHYWDGDMPARSGNLKAYPSDAEAFDYIYQILDETFIEGVTYTLSVWVGNAWPEQGYIDGWGLYFTGEDYEINLIEAHGLALSADWEQISLDYTATAADAGKKIGIKMSGEEGESYVTFEDVTLSYENPVVASNPNPANGQADVPWDVVLSWRPGMSAAPTNGHIVYLGERFEDVNNATGGTAQTATIYDPVQPLDFGKTYYWRVDEISGAPDNAILRGKVWSFTVEPLAIPVENVLATSNGASDAGSGPERTVDGSGLNAEDQHSTVAADMWLAVPGDEPLSIQYEFERVRKLHEMLLWNYNEQFELMLGFGIKDVTVEYSENGVDWTILGNVELAQATAQADYTANTTVDFGGVAARFVKLTVNSSHGTQPVPQYGLSEVRFMFIPVQAREPQPADDAANVAIDAMLAWRAGRDAVSHDVYFGVDAEALPLVDTVETASDAPGALDLDTTYSWRIDENQETESWAGSVWTFSTQAYLVVDDFESYTDDLEAGGTIFQAWLDGYESDDNGSLVGNIEAPFAEQTIVNSGKQSMPLFYDNSGAGMSEAEFTLAQNWTTNGIKSLSLFFYGAEGNTGQLYVKINNTKVAYDGDAADLAKAQWQPWNIDLSTIGGNISSVTSLAIGVEGAGASGVVYVDNIRLYPQAPEFITPVEPDAAGLVLHFALDDGTGMVAADSSGNGNNGTLDGDPTWITGVSGGALDFDGTRDHIATGKRRR